MSAICKSTVASLLGSLFLSGCASTPPQAEAAKRAPASSDPSFPYYNHQCQGTSKDGSVYTFMFIGSATTQFNFAAKVNERILLNSSGGYSVDGPDFLRHPGAFKVWGVPDSMVVFVKPLSDQSAALKIHSDKIDAEIEANCIAIPQ